MNRDVLVTIVVLFWLIVLFYLLSYFQEGGVIAITEGADNFWDGRLPPTDREEEDTYTLVVIRCKGNLTWLSDVPRDWTIKIYEKCSTTPSSKHSVMTATQAEAEECNGYLDYIVDYYDDLNSITAFMHDDGLYPWSKSKGRSAHTPFHSFTQVVNATKQYLTSTQGYVTMGVTTRSEPFGEDNYHGLAQKILWPYLQTKNMSSPPKYINYKPSAHFAVRRQAIHSRSKSVYEAILNQTRHSRNVPNHLDSRQVCCAMERMWHILFGELPNLPLETRIVDMMLEAGTLDTHYH